MVREINLRSKLNHNINITTQLSDQLCIHSNLIPTTEPLPCSDQTGCGRCILRHFTAIVKAFKNFRVESTSLHGHRNTAFRVGPKTWIRLTGKGNPFAHHIKSSSTTKQRAISAKFFYAILDLSVVWNHRGGMATGSSFGLSHLRLAWASWRGRLQPQDLGLNRGL